MNRIAKRLNPLLDEMDIFHELTEAETIELERVDVTLLLAESNMSLLGTTAGTIDRREAEFGLTGDPSKPLSDRVAVLVAQLRGQGTTTPAFIKALARSFQYGEIDVVEDPDMPYIVNIVFQSIYGIPPSLSDFKQALDRVKPAHVIFQYEYRFMTWDEFDGYNKTWDRWDALNLTWDALQEYKEG
ncbi:MAG: putative phage tail protein [Clostridia bacterium]|nr:putative phage tail protein [Clostridiales bacterium]MDU7504560.1 putative phage tail protein [Clostridia bacterium]